MFPAYLTIAKKEIMDNIRNVSIIIFTVIFAILVLIVSYYGSMSAGFQGLEATIGGMMLLVFFLIPIIGLVLGHAAINREIESGSMNSLVTYPVERWEVVIGKFLGLGGVLSFSIFVGFGIAGIIIGLNIPNLDYGSYLFFIVVTILLGLAFMSISMLFSTILKNRTSSIVLAIFLWFLFTMLWSLIMVGLVLATSKSYIDAPDWVYGFFYSNPIYAYEGLVSLNVVPTGQGVNTNAASYPWFYSTGALMSVILMWIIVSLVSSIIIFYKKDI